MLGIQGMGKIFVQIQSESFMAVLVVEIVLVGEEDLHKGEEETLLAGRLGIVFSWRIFQAKPPGRT